VIILDVLKEMCMQGLPEKRLNFLWHYTSWRGLEGIFRDHELWASQIGYLNDALEVDYAERAFRVVLLRSLTRRDRPRLIGEVEDDLMYRVRWSRVPIFGTSFSADPDSLSQWRAYGVPAGFAIGFNIDRLRSVIAAGLPEFRLEPCSYTFAQQRERLDDLVRLAHKFLRLKVDWNQFCSGHVTEQAASEAYEPVNTAMATVCEEFAKRGPELKHTAFREEREWRLSACSLEKNNALGFHPSGSMIVPHVKLGLGSRSTSPIQRVVVGPCAHPVEVKQSIQLLASQCSIALSAVSSKVPYRNW
jgi:hypothetical protein